MCNSNDETNLIIQKQNEVALRTHLIQILQQWEQQLDALDVNETDDKK